MELLNFPFAAVTACSHSSGHLAHLVAYDADHLNANLLVWDEYWTERFITHCLLSNVLRNHQLEIITNAEAWPRGSSLTLGR